MRKKRLLLLLVIMLLFMACHRADTGDDVVVTVLPNPKEGTPIERRSSLCTFNHQKRAHRSRFMSRKPCFGRYM